MAKISKVVYAAAPLLTIATVSNLVATIAFVVDNSVVMVFALLFSVLFVSVALLSYLVLGNLPLSRITLSFTRASTYLSWIWLRVMVILLTLFDFGGAIFIGVGWAWIKGGVIARTDLLAFFLLFSFSLYWAVIYRQIIVNFVGMVPKEKGGFLILDTAAFAKLAASMLKHKRKDALTYLQWSLEGTEEFLQERNQRLQHLAKSIIVVEALKYEESVPYDDLLRISLALSEFPRLDRLPFALNEFLKRLDWSQSLDPIPPQTEKENIGQKLSAVATIIAAVGTFAIAFLEDNIRRELFKILTSSEVFSLPIAGFFAYTWLRSIKGMRAASIGDLRKYGKGIE